jgi:hypothetical protein
LFIKNELRHRAYYYPDITRMRNYLIKYDNHQAKLYKPLKWGKDGWKSVYEIIEFPLFPYTPASVDLITSQMMPHLTNELVPHRYKTENLTNPLRGHCYHATQVLFYLLDTDHLYPFRGEEEYFPLVLDEGEDWRNYHWWLEDVKEGTRFDPTAGQFDLLPYTTDHAYQYGRARKWYSFQETPSSKTFKLIDKIVPSSRHYRTTYHPDETPPTLETFFQFDDEPQGFQK